MITHLTFNNVQLNTLTRNNQIWLSSKEIALALGYAKTNAITHIYNTNTDEFSPGMTEIVDSTTSGNLRVRTRIFSLRGAHLIAMFARTPVAKEFRRWVLDILDREVGGPVFTPAEPEPVPIHEYAKGGSRTVVVHFDESGQIRDSYPLPEDSVMCTISTFRHYMEEDGWLVIRKDQLVDKLMAIK